ncbi:putative P-loop containing nucleoside triphosphate hydrolase [Helianthus annuus]|nr:putative P-loop containing nucleoside triphosphate hydrolase [Helianthus annuus]
MRNNVDFKRSFDLNDVRRSLKSVEVDFMSLNVDRMKTDSSPRPQRTLNQSSATQSTTSGNSLGSKKILDNIFVGIDRDAELIRDKLVDDGKKLDVVSIVGMGGIGKITVATKVFNDGYVKHHFRIRVWVTVSQTYDKRAVLIQILESIRDQLDLEKASDSRLRELVHKHLMGRRYLIVIDDIWHIETWDNLKLFFPHGDNGSRILITSRITEVAKHANLDGMILPLGCLNKEKGWELLCQKVFRGNKYPEWSLKPGMRIVESCHRLPLAVVVIAGVLAKEAWNEKFWMEIAYSASLYIVGDQNGCLEILGLSYNNLPLHLRECFLYLGGFPEDYMFKVRDLIWLWVAEGFIQQTENKSLEDIAEGYLMDLIDRNLVIVAHRSKSNEGVTACKVHDLVKELCLKKAKEERFILQTERLVLFFHRYNVITPPYKPVRVFINKDIYDPHIAHPPPQNLRSILWLIIPERWVMTLQGVSFLLCYLGC